MSGSNLTPEKIKSPIQLMAAWFVMLVSVITVLLTTAVNIDKPEWAAGYLVISASIVILIVIGCVLLMLTKYRPHLQDGKEYAQWIKDQAQYSSGYFHKVEDKPEGRVSGTEAQTSNIKNVLVSVIDVLGANEIIESLKNKGFNCEVHPHRDEEFDKRPPLTSIKGEQEGIWIGSRVDVDVAVRAIKVALKIWPDLKYIEIPSDSNTPPDHVNDQIFIGGSSSTPIRRGTKPWTRSELTSLIETMTIKEFHQKIREKYS